MEFDKLLLQRRSTREYTDRPVTKDEIDYILNAGIRAPSARNMQSWHFYAVTDPQVRQKFKKFCAEWVSSAPVIFVICTDGDAMIEAAGEKKGTKLITQDTALAMENMLLAAANIGLGGCIIGAHDDDICRSELNIPQKYLPVALMPVGEPAKEPALRERKPLEDVVTYI